MKTKCLLPLLLLLLFNVIGGAAQNATDLKQYSRRGYGDKSMNTDDLVWNASLARSFCKGRLTLCNVYLCLQLLHLFCRQSCHFLNRRFIHTLCQHLFSNLKTSFFHAFSYSFPLGCIN